MSQPCVEYAAISVQNRQKYEFPVHIAKTNVPKREALYSSFFQPTLDECMRICYTTNVPRAAFRPRGIQIPAGEEAGRKILSKQNQGWHYDSTS